MRTSKADKIKGLRARAKMPQFFRIAASGMIVLVVLAVGIGFYRARNRTEFRMKGFPTQLSKDVVAEVNGYERIETDGQGSRYYIKAGRALTFSDNHQEFEEVYLEVFDPSGQASDKITAQKAVHVPEPEKNFTAYFAGDVNIVTRDSLSVKTDQLTYKKATEIASADERVEFARDSLSGESFGAIVNVREKRLELLRDVSLQAAKTDDPSVKQAELRAGYAVYDQINETVDVAQGVDATVTSASGRSNILSNRAKVYFVSANGGRDVTKVELFENVRITSIQNGEAPVNINSGYALYERMAERFVLRDGVHAMTAENDQPVNLRSSSAVYEQLNGRIALEGSAEITQANELVKGDRIDADLYPTKKLKHAVVNGNAYLRQAAPDKSVEVWAGQLNADFNESQVLTNANAVTNSKAMLIPAVPAEYSKVTMSAPRAIHLVFKGEGMIDRMSTDGRTTVQLDAPGGAADAANKRLTADSVNTLFNESGKDLAKAEAVGNAELYVEPLQAAESNYKTTVTASRFDCEFFPTGNSAKQCIAGDNAKALRVPTVAGRGDQVLSSRSMTVLFDQQTKDINRMDASGGAKFTELDRNATAAVISYTHADRTVRLRDGEPIVWDGSARAKAVEIDWNTADQTSALRGGVSTTYYSQKQTGGAAPFGETNKPVYVTSENAEFNHRAETGTFSGNARGWQENNYVRADRFLIQQKEGQFHASGNVQSLLYNARRKENGRERVEPVYAASQEMRYNRDNRILRYDNSVDIRQGTDRIVGKAANVFLTENNEVARTDIEGSVIITQPNRRAAGDFAQYVAAEERVILRGNPARVEDSENGTTSGGELTVYLKNNRVLGEGKTKQNAAGRTRSVYKVKN